MSAIKYLTKEEFRKLNNGEVFYDGFHVVLSCQYIQTWEQLAEALGNAFQFPMRNEGLNGTWDWITDLTWLGTQESIKIYFYNSQELFKDDTALKKYILEWFERVAEFWREDVKNAFLEGKPGEPKNFEIYLVD